MRQIPVFQQIILDNQGKDSNGLPAIVYAKEHETDKIISDIAALVYQEINKSGSTENIITIFNKVMEDRFNFYNPKSDDNKELLNNIKNEEGKDAYNEKYKELNLIKSIFNINSDENKHNVDVILNGLKDKYKLFQFNPFEDD
jgi:rRNA maturation protein Rpf1